VFHIIETIMPSGTVDHKHRNAGVPDALSMKAFAVTSTHPPPTKKNKRERKTKFSKINLYFVVQTFSDKFDAFVALVRMLLYNTYTTQSLVKVRFLENS
jgi:hypothetical protein